MSTRADGSEVPAGGFEPSLSGDGRYVAFQSSADDLVPGDSNGRTDIFVKDRWTGAVELVSVRTDGVQSNGFSVSPVITPDGRYVAFDSNATNLAPGASAVHTYVRDRLTGTLTWVSGRPDGSPTEGRSAFSGKPAITPDGRFVAFAALAGLVPADANNATDVYVRDLHQPGLEWVSVDPSPRSFSSDAYEYRAFGPAISADGRIVTFVSPRTGLVPDDGNGSPDVFARDRATGKTERVSVSSQGVEGNGGSSGATISADGRYVAFTSYASSLVPNSADTNPIGGNDIFVRDRLTNRTRKVSVLPGGEPADAGNSSPVISADGRWIAFVTTAANLVGDPSPLTTLTGGGRQLSVVVDRVTGQVRVASVSGTGAYADGASTNQPALSDDGRFFAFNSLARNLVPGDTNGTVDVYVHDLGPALGVGGVVAQRTGPAVEVSAWASAAGVPLVAAVDPADDDPMGLGERGGDLVGASLAARPDGGLTIRLQVARMPKASAPGNGTFFQTGPSLSGTPGVLYGLELSVGTSRYQIRATADPAGWPGSAHAGVFVCSSWTCTERAHLSASVGTTDDEVEIDLPLWKIGASQGVALEGLRAWAATGAALDAALLAQVDDLTLDDAVVPAVTVAAAAGSAGASPGGLAFAPLQRAGSTVWGTVGAPAGPAGVWVRICQGGSCSWATRDLPG